LICGPTILSLSIYGYFKSPATFSRRRLYGTSYNTSGKKDGKPRFEVLTGFDRKTGEPYWSGIGVKTAQGILDNEQAFKAWVAKQTGKKQ